MSTAARPGALPRAALRAQALGSHLPPLLVAAERIAATVAQGVHGRRRVGQGDSFWQFRPLLPGEAASRIDWRRSARAERGHFVRQMEWEAAQTVSVWRAGGAGMRWRSAASLPEKQERADLLLLALSALLLRGGERVRLLGAGVGAGRLDVTGQPGLARLAAALDDGAAGPDGFPDPGGVPKHGCVVLIGDFLEPLDDVRATIGGLAARGAAGQVLQILDPAEVALPYAGRVRFTAPGLNAGPGGMAALIGRAETVRAAYGAKLADQQAGLAAICRAAGMGLIIHHTDHSPTAALLALHAALAPRRARA